MSVVADFDPSTPSIARVYDYLLDGKDNFAIDREVAERLMAVAPLAAEVTRENRQFLARAVTWTAKQGIRPEHVADVTAVLRGRRPGMAPGLGAGRASPAP
jgi:hypothetical protein